MEKLKKKPNVENKLTNEQKKLLYVGKTNRTLEERFNEHFDNEKSTINKYCSKLNGPFQNEIVLYLD